MSVRQMIVRYLKCDRVECFVEFYGEPGQLAKEIRVRAQAQGWHCTAPVIGVASQDLCPYHCNG